MLLPAAAKLRLLAGCRARCQSKQKKYQRARISRYHEIKEPRSPDMKYYSVAEGLSSVAKPSNKREYPDKIVNVSTGSIRGNGVVLLLT